MEVLDDRDGRRVVPHLPTQVAMPTVKVVSAVTNYMNVKEETKRMKPIPGVVVGFGVVAGATTMVTDNTIGRVAKFGQNAPRRATDKNGERLAAEYKDAEDDCCKGNRPQEGRVAPMSFLAQVRRVVVASRAHANSYSLRRAEGGGGAGAASSCTRRRNVRAVGETALGRA